MAYILHGWDVAVTGSMGCDVDDGTDSGAALIESGTYAHRDLSSVTGAGTYADFATDLQAELDTVLATNGSTVSFSTSTYYTITLNASANPNLDFQSAQGKRLAAALGFDYQHTDASGGSSSDPYNITLGGSTSYTSNVAPYYWRSIERSGVSDYVPPLPKSGQTQRGISSNATAYAVRPTNREYRTGWRLMFEPQAAVFAAHAAASARWTWEDLWDSAWSKHPCVLNVSGASIDFVFYLIDGELSDDICKPSFGKSYHGKWNIDVRAQWAGNL